MKIAVATHDGQKISRTFCGCNYFKIFEVEKGRIVGKNERPNTFTARKKKKFKSSFNGSTGKINGIRNVAEGVRDCHVVICHKMDRGSWSRLGISGKEMIFTSMTYAEKAVRKYLSGDLVDEYNQCVNSSA